MHSNIYFYAQSISQVVTRIKLAKKQLFIDVASRKNALYTNINENKYK